ncbi:MAG: hypothetical protein R2874_10010 [Desulfobacterales bacterium]
MLFIKAYVGAFYLEKGISSSDALTDVPRQLVLHYFHAIPGEDFATATTEMIKKMFPTAGSGPCSRKLAT